MLLARVSLDIIRNRHFYTQKFCEISTRSLDNKGLEHDL